MVIRKLITLTCPLREPFLVFFLCFIFFNLLYSLANTMIGSGYYVEIAFCKLHLLVLLWLLKWEELSSSSSTRAASCFVKGGDSDWRLQYVVTDFILDVPSKENTVNPLKCLGSGGVFRIACLFLLITALVKLFTIKKTPFQYSKSLNNLISLLKKR